MQKRLLTLCLLLLPLCSWGETSYAQAQAEAKAILKKMHEAILVLDEGFNKQYPENLANPAWIKLKLENMAVIDQLIRRVLVENIMTRDWPLPVKRAYLEFFFNLSEKTLNEETLGYAQRNDLYNYRELKRLLRTSPKLTPYGWPVFSVFDQECDYYAFLIAQHGQTYDKKWQEKTLIPRLERIARKGECSRVSYLWLKNPSTDYLKELPPILEQEGGLWEAMIPEVNRLSAFFDAVPRIMQAPQIPPLRIE